MIGSLSTGISRHLFETAYAYEVTSFNSGPDPSVSRGGGGGGGGGHNTA